MTAGAEIDAIEAFDQVVEAIDDVLGKYRKRSGGRSHMLPASCFWHSLVGVNANGRPTTKVFGWADTRSSGSIANLQKEFDESEIHNRTGARFHSSYWPAKLLWLRKTSPKVFRRTAKWLSLSDFIALKMFGTAVTSVSMASGTGIFDIRRCDWDVPLIKFLHVKRENLPALPATDSKSFKLVANYARRWPRLKNAQWFPAIGDGAANNIGAGCVTRSKAALMIGTSGGDARCIYGRPACTHSFRPLVLSNRQKTYDHRRCIERRRWVVSMAER